MQSNLEEIEKKTKSHSPLSSITSLSALSSSSPTIVDLSEVDVDVNVSIDAMRKGRPVDQGLVDSVFRTLQGSCKPFEDELLMAVQELFNRTALSPGKVREALVAASAKAVLAEEYDIRARASLE